VQETIRRHGQPVVGFGLGSMPLPAWVATRDKLQGMDRLIASGRGDMLVEGGGCTEPGGGIVPTRRTAIEMAALLREQMSAGLGAEAPREPERHSPWKEAVIVSAVGAATGWLLEEIARRTFRRKRGR
jgi:hypothetical protein